MTDTKADNQRLPYRLKEPFLTTTELALFRVLNQMADGRYLICPKVALNDLFYIVRPNENVHFFNKFFRKHVDFLMCDPQTLAPVFGVEILRPISKNEAREFDETVSSRVTRDSDSVPQCPVCGKMMVLRIRRTGMNSGKKYYGCMDNPRCSGLVAID